jgi:hypothetical protein
MLILTRGFARLFAKEFLVVVTDRRMLVIPTKRIAGKTVYDEMISIDSEDIQFGINPFNDLVVRINVPGLSYPLKMRYVMGFHPDWTERQRFQTALEGFISAA